MEMVEWFRWRLHKKKKHIMEQSSIPDIRIIKCSKTGFKRFTEAQNMLRKQFPGLTTKNWMDQFTGRHQDDEEKRDNTL